MSKRRPVPPTVHLRAAIRKIDQAAWKLHDEQLAASIAYVLAVCRSDKREIRKLFFAKLAAFGDRAVMLEGKLTPNERQQAIRLTAYEAEIESLYDAAKRLRSRLEGIYISKRDSRPGFSMKRGTNGQGRGNASV
ncbi:MAG: hypothetical protein ACRD5K_05490 [Candidatus Acidiferrales bacterium]